MLLEAHVDDLHLAGPKAELEKLVQGMLASGLHLKEAEYYSPVEPAEYTHLRRIRRISLEGRYIKPNPGHIVKAAQLLGVANEKPDMVDRMSPRAANDRGEEPEDLAPLDVEAAVLHRRLARDAGSWRCLLLCAVA